MRKILLSVLGALLAVGCASHLGRATQYVHAAGGAAEQIGAYVHAADLGVTAAKKHADATGKALLDQVSGNHGQALTSLKMLNADLDYVQHQVDAMGSQITSLTAERNELLHSWGHRGQVIITGSFYLILGLLAFHAIGVVVAPLLPAPFNLMVGVAAKIINPAGWFLWLGSKIEQRVLSKTVKPPIGTASDPISAVIVPPKSVSAK